MVKKDVVVLGIRDGHTGVAALIYINVGCGKK